MRPRRKNDIKSGELCKISKNMKRHVMMTFDPTGLFRSALPDQIE